MRLTVIAGEVRRNLSSGTARMNIGFFCLTVIIVLLSLADLLTVGRLQKEAQQFVSAAGATRGIALQSGISGQACDGLSGMGTIQASGALADSPSLRLLAMPQVVIQTYRVTTGLADVIGADDPLPGGVWIDSGLAGALQASVGTELATDQGMITIGAVFDWPQDGRDQRFSFAVLLPEAPTGLFDECWMLAWPTADANDTLLRATQIADPGLTPATQIGQLNMSLGSNLDASQLFITRLTRFSPAVLLIVGFALALALARARRLEYASALHAGVVKSDQLFICSLETLTWAIPAAFVAEVAVWVTTRIVGMSDVPTLLSLAARGPILALVGSIIGALVGCAGAREKHLFRLFKNR